MSGPNGGRRVIAPMPPRDAGEAHRAATPLELLFDLVSVIAIAAAAAGLHHAIAEGHAIQGVLHFIIGFFAIWWAWMNYTWFASAYDNDDVVFRILTLVLMAGSLVMAAGIRDMVVSLDLTLAIAGYVVMRVAMVLFWLRAARHDPVRRKTALTYAAGVFLVQILWVGFGALQPLPEVWIYVLFAIGVVLELAVPVIAERMTATPWHRHHIIERYGLLTIIVLGETLLSGSMAIQASGAALDAALVSLAFTALVIVFAMWWLYFSREDHLQTDDLSRALVWGYGHFLVFASGAAVGAGFAVLVDVVSHHAHISMRQGLFAVSVPAAVYVGALWLVRDRFLIGSGAGQIVLPGMALLVAAAPLLPFGLYTVAVLMVATVVLRNRVVSAV